LSSAVAQLAAAIKQVKFSSFAATLLPNTRRRMIHTHVATAFDIGVCAAALPVKQECLNMHEILALRVAV
jgi:hypothetical protein